MSIIETIEQWHKEGLLDEISTEFFAVASEIPVPSEVNETRRLTREQIQFCFEHLFPVVARGCHIHDSLLTVDVVVESIRDIMRSESFEELLCDIAHLQVSSEDDIAGDLFRSIDNRIWLKSEGERGEPN
ncbi:MAG: hypothetical protein KBA40_02005 [Candidatus Peribacteraceae bacterium]|nr:hypothetical protein [Candidatus Peribacteraceae bacterium]MBP9850661.1 hypothetical protein [Candidatus Peribacteraceae bacterium]